jgi:hypothetical protein
MTTDGIVKSPFNILQECIIDKLTHEIRIQGLLLTLCVSNVSCINELNMKKVGIKTNVR